MANRLPRRMILFTGFPGFLGSELLPRVLRAPRREPGGLPGAAEVPRPRRAAAAELVSREPGLARPHRLVEGDITLPGLGLAAPRGAGARVSEVFHLAAVYDLAVPRAVGLKVNVEGTRQVLDFAAGCSRLDRFQYVSTCYVSGRYAGIYRESDLDKGQEFNNYYEETKFLAEVEVQAAMKRASPPPIYRPAIVVGDSRTGDTQKYDGPYFAIRWLLRQPGIALMPVVGDTSRTRLNLVPRDFVIAAIDHLAALPAARGKVYQLADPEPLTIAEVLEAIAKASGAHGAHPAAGRGRQDGDRPRARRLPPDEDPLGHGRLLRAPDLLRHHEHPGRPRPAGIRVPPLRTYLPALVGFMKAHPEVGSEAMA